MSPNQSVSIFVMQASDVDQEGQYCTIQTGMTVEQNRAGSRSPRKGIVSRVEAISEDTLRVYVA
jgi:hypothetical protein